MSEQTKEISTMNQSVYFNPQVWEQMQRVAQCFITSKALSADVQNLPQLMMKLQAGYEMGMQPMESLNSLYILNGSINLWGKATTKRLKKFGYKIKYVESTKEKCTVEITSPSGEVFTETYTMQEAQDAGLTGKFAYTKFPLEKLRWNALRRVINFHCPEILDGLDIKEVAEDFDNVFEGEIVEDQDLTSNEKPQKIEDSEQEPSFDNFKKSKEEPKEKEETPEEKKKREQEEIAKTIASNPEVLNV